MTTTVLTWTLMVYMTRVLVFHPDIATLADCEKMRQAVIAQPDSERIYIYTKCVPVNKVLGVLK